MNTIVHTCTKNMVKVNSVQIIHKPVWHLVVTLKGNIMIGDVNLLAFLVL